MRINCADVTTLEEAGIMEGMKVHLQDEIQINKRSKFTNNYFLGDSLSSLPSPTSSYFNSSSLVVSTANP